MFNTLNGNGVIVWPYHDYKQIDNVNAVIDSDSNKMPVSVRVACGLSNMCVTVDIPVDILTIHIPFILVPHNKSRYENISYIQNTKRIMKIRFESELKLWMWLFGYFAAKSFIW